MPPKKDKKVKAKPKRKPTTQKQKQQQTQKVVVNVGTSAGKARSRKSKTPSQQPSPPMPSYDRIIPIPYPLQPPPTPAGLSREDVRSIFAEMTVPQPIQLQTPIMEEARRVAPRLTVQKPISPVIRIPEGMEEPRRAPVRLTTEKPIPPVVRVPESIVESRKAPPKLTIQKPISATFRVPADITEPKQIPITNIEQISQIVDKNIPTPSYTEQVESTFSVPPPLETIPVEPPKRKPKLIIVPRKDITLLPTPIEEEKNIVNINEPPVKPVKYIETTKPLTNKELLTELKRIAEKKGTNAPSEKRIARMAKERGVDKKVIYNEQISYYSQL